MLNTATIASATSIKNSFNNVSPRPFGETEGLGAGSAAPRAVAGAALGGSRSGFRFHDFYWANNADSEGTRRSRGFGHCRHEMVLAFASIRKSRIHGVYYTEHEFKPGTGANRHVDVHGVAKPAVVLWLHLIQCHDPRRQSKIRLRRIGSSADLSVHRHKTDLALMLGDVRSCGSGPTSRKFQHCVCVKSNFNNRPDRS
jgi:hypothetical protein